MNCAARTTLALGRSQTSVSRLRAALSRNPIFLFVAEYGPNNFTEITRIPNLDVQI
jgi:hypothetical protein